MFDRAALTPLECRRGNLMILRRLTQNLREQNWTAITIEFFIVVLGVFIANQVTDWNAHEADKRRGAAYLQQLTTDVQGNVVETRRLIGYYEAVQAGAFGEGGRAHARLST